MHNVSSSFLILLLLQNEVFNLLMKLTNIVIAFLRADYVSKKQHQAKGE